MKKFVCPKRLYSILEKRNVQLFYSLILGMSLVTLSSGATAEEAHSLPDSRIQAISSKLKVVFSCTDRFWPGIDKEAYRILFVQPSKKTNWLWLQKTSKMEPVQSTELPPEASLAARYTFGLFRGDRVIIIDLDMVPPASRIPLVHTDAAVNLAVHEGFHDLIQFKAPWEAYFAVGGSSDIPKDQMIEIFYVRRMLALALIRELSTNSSFGESSFWFKKMQALPYPGQSGFSDVSEGTAYYVEILTSILAENGCDVSESVLSKKALDAIRLRMDETLKPELQAQLYSAYASGGYGAESYNIGAASLLALRKKGVIVGAKDFPAASRNYFEDIKKTSDASAQQQIYHAMVEAQKAVKSPAALLLTPIIPVEARDDESLLKTIQAAASSSESKTTQGQ